MNLLLHLPLIIFERPYVRGCLSIERDHLEFHDFVADRQRRAYDLVREQRTFTAARVEDRNSAFSVAFKHILLSITAMFGSGLTSLPQPFAEVRLGFSWRSWRSSGMLPPRS